MTGRPSEYTEAKADAICEALIEGRSLRSICRDEDMPNAATVFRWLQAHPAFSERYTRAREAQADTLVDDSLDIADDGSNDFMERQNKDGSTYLEYNGDAVQRSRLRVETRKWFASKLRPMKYGDRTVIAGDKDAPLAVADVSDLERAKAVAALVARAKGGTE